MQQSINWHIFPHDPNRWYMSYPWSAKEKKTPHSLNENNFTCLSCLLWADCIIFAKACTLVMHCSYMIVISKRGKTNTVYTHTLTGHRLTINNDAKQWQPKSVVINYLLIANPIYASPFLFDTFLNEIVTKGSSVFAFTNWLPCMRYIFLFLSYMLWCKKLIISVL